eukprot:TRINITY_DN1715_c0_g1_i7.p2 TRINITY_DN1715_c0_g1~~TRINITY_DN1715_c0_g1_i7.p2  ORF type:complete len:114 (+),score=27.40 TRINITY_DN1715_c0_g1_i7:99-440(+)
MATAKLRFLLLSGKDLTTDVSEALNVEDLKKKVASDWTEEGSPPNVADMKIIFSGKILENNTKLSDHGIHNGQTYTLHLVIRQSVAKDPEVEPLPNKMIVKPASNVTCTCNLL